MKNQTRSHPTAEDVLNDAQTLGNDTKQFVSDSMGDRMSSAMSSLRSRMSEAKERLSEYYGVAKEKTIAGGKAADRVVRERPYTSLAVVFGLGLVVGYLLSGRDDD